MRLPCIRASVRGSPLMGSPDCNELSGDTPRRRKQPVGIMRFLPIRLPLTPCRRGPAPPHTGAPSPNRSPATQGSKMPLQKLNQPGAHGARTLVTLRAHLEEAASNAIVAKPPAVSTKRPRLMPRRRMRVGRADRPGICNWPESERPREKLLEQGPQVLSDG